MGRSSGVAVIAIIALVAVSAITGVLLISNYALKRPLPEKEIEVQKSVVEEKTLLEEAEEQSESPVADNAVPLVTYKPTPTPTIVPTPTPTPTLPDIRIRYGDITRYINDGSGKGLVSQGVDLIGSSPTYDLVNELWRDDINACVDIESDYPITNNFYVKFYNGDSVLVEHLVYSSSSNGKPLIVRYCAKLPRSAGNYKIDIKINEDRSQPESNYSNNTMSFTYQMRGDTEPPTFYIVGPNKEAEGTCIFAQSLRDNLTLYSNIKIEHYIDDQPATLDSYRRVCLDEPAGIVHTYRVVATDQSGNKNEQSKTFTTL